jgi:hypothetical protein
MPIRTTGQDSKYWKNETVAFALPAIECNVSLDAQAIGRRGQSPVQPRGSRFHRPAVAPRQTHVTPAFAKGAER